MSDAAVWLEPVSGARRFGLKGPRAAELLRQQGLQVPAGPNSWAPLTAQDADDSRNVIARLGHSEFFIEECEPAPAIVRLEAQLAAAPDGAYPVLREDRAMVLGGARATEALAEVCNVNFAAPAPGRPVVMTLMTGVAVLVLSQPTAAGTVHRIWCDPSFGSCLWDTLTTTTGRSA